MDNIIKRRILGLDNEICIFYIFDIVHSVKPEIIITCDSTYLGVLCCINSQSFGDFSSLNIGGSPEADPPTCHELAGQFPYM